MTTQHERFGRVRLAIQTVEITECQNERIGIAVLKVDCSHTIGGKDGIKILDNFQSVY